MNIHGTIVSMAILRITQVIHPTDLDTTDG